MAEQQVNQFEGGESQTNVIIPNRVFVGGIAYNTTELELKNFFQEMFGHVKDSKIITDREGVSKGYGFITFDNQTAANEAISRGTIYFCEKKLNIGSAIRKPGSGQFAQQEGQATDKSPSNSSQVSSPKPRTRGRHGGSRADHVAFLPQAITPAAPSQMLGYNMQPYLYNVGTQYQYTDQFSITPVAQTAQQPQYVPQEAVAVPPPPPFNIASYPQYPQANTSMALPAAPAFCWPMTNSTQQSYWNGQSAGWTATDVQQPYATSDVCVDLAGFYASAFQDGIQYKAQQPMYSGSSAYRRNHSQRRGRRGNNFVPVPAKNGQEDEPDETDCKKAKTGAPDTLE